jgi:hypothetical protein
MGCTRQGHLLLQECIIGKSFHLTNPKKSSVRDEQPANAGGIAAIPVMNPTT